MLLSENSKSGTAGGSNFVASFFLPSKEQKRAKAEFEKWQKEFKQKSGENVMLLCMYVYVCMCLYVCVCMYVCMRVAVIMKYPLYS